MRRCERLCRGSELTCAVTLSGLYFTIIARDVSMPPHRMAALARYFPQTATSGPAVVSGVTPHDAEVSERYVAAPLLVPQYADMTISSSRHVIMQSRLLVQAERTRRNCDEVPGVP